MNHSLFVWVVLPLLIVLARMTDVSLGTMRIIFVMRGVKLMAALLGFIEVFIWIVVIGRLMTANTGWLHYAAYAGGFALGSSLGICIEQRLAFGLQTVRVITGQNIESLKESLIQHGFGGTSMPATGIQGSNMTILFSTVRRKHVPQLMQLIQSFVPKAFVSVEDVRIAREGYIPIASVFQQPARIFSFDRKGK